MRARLPALLASVVAAAEGLAFAALGVGELVVAGSGSGAVASAAFFLVCAGALGWCAIGLARLQPWSRGPLVAAQLLLLAIAWTYRQPHPGWSGVLAAGAAGCLVLLLAPATTRSLTDDPARE